MKTKLTWDVGGSDEFEGVALAIPKKGRLPKAAENFQLGRGQCSRTRIRPHRADLCRQPAPRFRRLGLSGLQRRGRTDRSAGYLPECAGLSNCPCVRMSVCLFVCHPRRPSVTRSSGRLRGPSWNPIHLSSGTRLTFWHLGLNESATASPRRNLLKRTLFASHTYVFQRRE